MIVDGFSQIQAASPNKKMSLPERVITKRSKDPLYVAIDHQGPFHQQGLTLIPTWISNYIDYKGWDYITSTVQSLSSEIDK